MKKWSALLLAMALMISFALFGCSNADDTSSKDNDSAGTGTTDTSQSGNNEKVTMRITWWGSQTRHDQTLKVLEMFQQKYPNITFEPEFTAWDGYWEKIAAEAAAGSLPDVWQQDYQYISQYANKNLLLDLQPYVDEGKLDLSDVDQNSIAGGIINDKLYGINLGNNSLCMIYDPEIFKQAGVAEPTPELTWEDYVNVVKTIHEKTGLYGDENIPGNYFHGLNHYIRQHGPEYDLYSEDGTKLGYDNDKWFEEFFSMELDLIKAGAIPLPEVRNEIKTPEDSLLVSKKSAMIGAINSNQIVATATAAGRPLKMTLLPKAKDQVREGQYIKPSMFFSVTQYTKYPDQAVEFVNYFINDIEANKVMMAERGVPISAKVREALKPSLPDAQKQMFDYVDLVIENSSPIGPPQPAGHAEIDKLLKTLEEQICYEQITPAAAAAKFREEATKILSQNAQ
ncbi:MAG: pectin-derived oligosaccharide transport system substrate-binding protein [Clostridiales bacterium]|nr:pectin-derived oligosaccharide transport system substrate-binding protein [Clostridiales bacterium]